MLLPPFCRAAIQLEFFLRTHRVAREQLSVGTRVCTAVVAGQLGRHGSWSVDVHGLHDERFFLSLTDHRHRLTLVGTEGLLERTADVVRTATVARVDAAETIVTRRITILAVRVALRLHDLGHDVTRTRATRIEPRLDLCSRRPSVGLLERCRHAQRPRRTGVADAARPVARVDAAELSLRHRWNGESEQ